MRDAGKGDGYELHEFLCLIDEAILNAEERERQHRDEIIQIRRDLHRIPEPAYTESKTGKVAITVFNFVDILVQRQATHWQKIEDVSIA